MIGLLSSRAMTVALLLALVGALAGASYAAGLTKGRLDTELAASRRDTGTANALVVRAVATIRQYNGAESQSAAKLAEVERKTNAAIGQILYEISHLPTRDCGLTHAERLLLESARAAE